MGQRSPIRRRRVRLSRGISRNQGHQVQQRNQLLVFFQTLYLQQWLVILGVQLQVFIDSSFVIPTFIPQLVAQLRFPNICTPIKCQAPQQKAQGVSPHTGFLGCELIRANSRSRITRSLLDWKPSLPITFMLLPSSMCIIIVLMLAYGGGYIAYSHDLTTTSMTNFLLSVLYIGLTSLFNS
jgi:hypothetical protein